MNPNIQNCQIILLLKNHFIGPKLNCHTPPLSDEVDLKDGYIAINKYGYRGVLRIDIIYELLRLEII